MRRFIDAHVRRVALARVLYIRRPSSCRRCPRGPPHREGQFRHPRRVLRRCRVLHRGRESIRALAERAARGEDGGLLGPPRASFAIVVDASCSRSRSPQDSAPNAVYCAQGATLSARNGAPRAIAYGGCHARVPRSTTPRRRPNGRQIIPMDHNPGRKRCEQARPSEHSSRKLVGICND
jgi:hypothetical protein